MDSQHTTKKCFILQMRGGGVSPGIPPTQGLRSPTGRVKLGGSRGVYPLENFII